MDEYETAHCGQGEPIKPSGLVRVINESNRGRRAAAVDPLHQRVQDFLPGAVVAVWSVPEAPFEESGEVVEAVAHTTI